MRVLRLILATPLIVANTLVHVVPLLVVALAKLALPFAGARRIGNVVLTAIAESWIGVNNWIWPRLIPTRVVVQSDARLDPAGHYLVLANHQSWVDILVMQKVLNRRIPLMRFFLKRQLIYVPLLGLAWWALDFPFMGRYTPRQVAKNPDLARRDIEATRRACEKFRDMPVAIMNFAEGTRYTANKHAAQGSPYAGLLKPKAGGVAFVLNAMGEGLNAILDITIAYPEGIPTWLDLVTGRIGVIRMRIRERPIPEELSRCDYRHERADRIVFQRWINALWQDKERDLAALLAAREG